MIGQISEFAARILIVAELSDEEIYGPDSGPVEEYLADLKAGGKFVLDLGNSGLKMSFKDGAYYVEEYSKAELEAELEAEDRFRRFAEAAGLRVFAI